jgi:capsule polysaccharide export protein KpsE/RkpR
VPVRDTLSEVPGNGLSEASLIADPIEKQRSFFPYLQLFWANRQILLLTAFYAAIATTLIAFLIPARYQSLTRLMPPDGNSGSGLGLLAAMAGRGGSSTGSGGGGGLSGLAGLGGLAGDLFGVKSSGALFIGVLNSQTVQDAMIDKFELRKVYHDSKIEDAREDLAEHTGLSEDRKSGIISISVMDHNPKRAAAMAQAYVVELDRLVAQVSTSSARRERIFLEERLRKVKADLDTAAKNFGDFASKNTAIDIPTQGKAMLEAAAVLQGQLIAAQAELSGLQQIYTNNNVRVRAAEARIQELTKKLNEVGGAGTQGELESDHSLYPPIRRLPLLGVTYADLFREAKIQETVYELLTQQYEMAKVQEAKEIPTVKVLDVAIAPTKKSFPPRALIVVLGTVLGVMLAMAWIVGKARWEGVDANDPRKVLAMEVLTTVQARVPQFSRNGAGAESNGHWTWSPWNRNGANSDRQKRSPEIPTAHMHANDGERHK